MGDRLFRKYGPDLSHARPSTAPLPCHPDQGRQLPAERQNQIRRVRKKQLRQVGQNSVADRNEKWVSFQLPLTALEQSGSPSVIIRTIFRLSCRGSICCI